MAFQKLLRESGKRTYTLVVGKLNPAKLANFLEIDVFVLVSCPHNFLLEQKDFHRPIVSPFEVCILRCSYIDALN